MNDFNHHFLNNMFSFYYSQTIEMNLVKSDKVLDISLFFHLEDLIHFISHQQEII